MKPPKDPLLAPQLRNPLPLFLGRNLSHVLELVLDRIQLWHNKFRICLSIFQASSPPFPAPASTPLTPPQYLPPQSTQILPALPSAIFLPKIVTYLHNSSATIFAMNYFQTFDNIVRQNLIIDAISVINFHINFPAGKICFLINFFRFDPRSHSELLETTFWKRWTNFGDVIGW